MNKEVLEDRKQGLGYSRNLAQVSMSHPSVNAPEQLLF